MVLSSFFFFTEPCPIDEKIYAQMKKFIVDYKEKGHYVGMIDKLHLAIADREGMDGERPLQLATLFNQNIGKLFMRCDV